MSRILGLLTSDAKFLATAADRSLEEDARKVSLANGDENFTHARAAADQQRLPAALLHILKAASQLK